MNTCTKCGGWHYRTDPCRAPKKSTAELKETRSPAPTGPANVQVMCKLIAVETRTEEGSFPEPVAGTQALPVDTHSEPLAERSSNPLRLGDATRKDAYPAAPKPKFDKTAYQREYMRRRRAAMKARNA